MLPNSRKSAVFPHIDWKSLFDGMPDAVAIVDDRHRFVWVNRSMESFLGVPSKDVIGRTCHEFVHASGVPVENCLLRKVRTTRRRESMELEIAGRGLWLKVSADPLFERDGRIAGAVHYVTDITPSRRAEESVSTHGWRLELLNRVGVEILREKDLDSVLRQTLREVCRFHGLPRSAVRLMDGGGSVIEYCEAGYPPGGPDFRLYRDSLVSGGFSEDGYIAAVEDVDELHFSAEWKAEMHRFRVGAYLGVPLLDLQDATGTLYLCHHAPHAWTSDEIATAEAVGRMIEIAVSHSRIFRNQREMTGRLLSLMNNVPGVVYRGLKDWSLVFIGADVERITGYTPEEFLGRSAKWHDLIHPDDLEYVKGVFRGAVREGRKVLKVDYRARHKDGTVRWLSDRRQLFFHDDGTFAYVDGLLLDITAQRQAEGELRATYENLQALIKASPLAIMLLSNDGTVRLWNPAAERIFGWTENEVVGALNPTVSREKSEEFRLLRERVMNEGGFSGVELSRRKKDGSPIDVRLSTAPVRDREGAIIGIMGVLEDITERKKIEESLKQSEDQLRQSQKMEAVGRLAGGVAHDFNNLLTAIRGYSDLLLLRLEPRSPMRKELEEIQKASERAAALTHQLLAFSRKQVLQPKVLDLNEVVANLDKMLRRLIGEDVDMVTILKPDLGAVLVDPGQIEQVIMNLVVNARDAMPRGGKVTIETANVNLGESYVRNRSVINPGPYVMLAISDTGVGMDEHTKTHLFEPFYTTKEKGKGTGLGLSTAYGIVKQSGGYIWVYSEPGEGTTFKVYFPPHVRGTDVEREKESAKASVRGGETVLLVEDDETVRSFVRDVLEMKGYRVLEAAGGELALGMVGRHRGPIHLVVTDVVMPRMSGRQLADSLVKSLPRVKILYMSGYTDDAIVQHGVLAPGIPFLQKPFTPDALLRKVREVLDCDMRGLGGLP